MINFTESEIEVFSLAELQSIGFDFLPGPDIAPEDSIDSCRDRSPKLKSLTAKPTVPLFQMLYSCIPFTLPLSA